MGGSRRSIQCLIPLIRFGPGPVTVGPRRRQKSHIGPRSGPGARRRRTVKVSCRDKTRGGFPPGRPGVRIHLKRGIERPTVPCRVLGVRWTPSPLSFDWCRFYLFSVPMWFDVKVGLPCKPDPTRDTYSVVPSPFAPDRPGPGQYLLQLTGPRVYSLFLPLLSLRTCGLSPSLSPFSVYRD